MSLIWSEFLMCSMKFFCEPRESSSKSGPHNIQRKERQDKCDVAHQAEAKEYEIVDSVVVVTIVRDNEEDEQDKVLDQIKQTQE